MKKLLVIGSTVVDVIINVDFLPSSKQDVHVLSQKMSLGGCAYNVYDTIRHFGVPATLFSPVGGGIFGGFVRTELAKRGIQSAAPTPESENGCCYCFVETSGERTFISNHGAEYLIYKDWLDDIDLSLVAGIYVCGLEIEETTGPQIVDFLSRCKDIPIYFAPGPRIMKIDSALLERLLSLSPVVHLNDDELLEYTNEADLRRGAEKLYAKTHNALIITCGSAGAYVYDGALTLVPPVEQACVADTIGAGDSHIGAVMAGVYGSLSLKDAVACANTVASAVVGVNGALLPRERFDALGIRLPSQK